MAVLSEKLVDLLSTGRSTINHYQPVDLLSTTINR